MNPSWMIVLGIESVSIAILIFGVVLYRYVLADHRIFIDSLQHTEGQEHKERMGFLGWVYCISTLLMSIAVTLVLFHISPLS